MGVFSRPDSPYWWLWIEGTKQREKTRFLIGQTTAEKKASLAEAEALYHQRMLDVGREAHGLVPARRPTILFSAYAQWYETHVAEHHRGKRREKQIIWTLIAAFGNRDLATITKDAVLTWRSERARATSPSTSNRELAVLKRMLTLAVPKYLEASPLAKLPMLRAPRRDGAVLSREQETALLKELQPADQALVICALDTLMRLSDVVNLRREQDRGTYLLVTDPKVKPYKVPISSRLRAALDGLPKGDPYYFAHRRHKRIDTTHSIIRNMLTRACTRAGIPAQRANGGITFHSFRHTGATRMLEAGVPLRVIQEIGGWRTLQQLERYAHVTDTAKVAAVEAIGPMPLPIHSRAQRKPRNYSRKRRAG